MSWVAWITDPLLPEASTLADHLGRALESRGERFVVLDVGHCRRLLTPGAPIEGDERPDVVDRAIVHVARLLADASIGVVLHGGGGGATFDLARATLPCFVTIDVTDGTRAARCVLDALAALAPHADIPRPTGMPAWAIWITGISGSGKT